jgi:flagellar basal body-associated protein FliL
MKKLAAILLLFVFAFNLFGYKLWSLYAEKQADKTLATALDNNQYSEDDLILVTKQLNLPYYNNTNEFTRADGEAEANGVYYTYVKFRINNNRLEMLCLPNTQKTKIRQAKNDFFTAMADAEKKAAGKTRLPADAVKKIMSDYDNQEIDGVTVIQQLSLSKHNSFYNSSLGTLHKLTSEQPPDFAAAV